MYLGNSETNRRKERYFKAIIFDVLQNFQIIVLDNVDWQYNY